MRKAVDAIAQLGPASRGPVPDRRRSATSPTSSAAPRPRRSTRDCSASGRTRSSRSCARGSSWGCRSRPTTTCRRSGSARVSPAPSSPEVFAEVDVLVAPVIPEPAPALPTPPWALWTSSWRARGASRASPGRSTGSGCPRSACLADSPRPACRWPSRSWAALRRGHRPPPGRRLPASHRLAHPPPAPRLGAGGGAPRYALSSHTRCMSIRPAGIIWKPFTYLWKIFCSLMWSRMATGASSTMSRTASS